MSAPISLLPLNPVPPRPKAANNIAWLIAERGLKAVGGVGVGVLLARHLGPEHYGSYGAAIGLATLAKEGVMLGFDRMIRRDLAARPDDAGKIIGSSVGLSLALAIFVALGLSAIAGVMVDDQETRRLTLIVVWMAMPQAFFSCEIWFESSGQARPLVWTRNAVWLLALTCRIALIISNAQVTAFAILALAEWACTYGAVVWLLRRLHFHQFVFSFDRAQIKDWFKEGWPAVLMVIVGSTADRIMVVAVRNLATDNAQAGYLNAALRITEIWWSISVIVAAVLLPRIVAVKKLAPERSADVMQLYANASLLIGFGAAIAVTLTAPFVIPRVFGAAYAPSALVMVILFWSGPVVFSTTARSQSWVTRGLLILDLPSVTTITVLQLSFTLLLVPRYGAIGAAIAMTSAQWLGFYGMALSVPALRRASQAQFQAFAALWSPMTTARSLYAFVAGMVGK
jgi:PST family polysaccharide transporter